MKTQLRFWSSSLLFAALGLLLALCIPGRLMAQLDRGEITGTVEDPSGAVVQNAAVLLTNVDTGVKTTTKSTSTGTYVFDDMLPGKYTVEFQAPGFEKYVVRDVVIQVQQVATIDAHLVTGNVQQSVTVTSSTPLLEAESAQVGQTVASRLVNDMPLATRDWGSLAQLSAGVNTDAPSNGSGGNGTADAGSSESAYFRVNGVDEWQNDFRLDGINDNIEIYGGNYTGTNAAIVPPPDAIEEFTLQSGDFSAEFGHSTGGIINASLKSGTNSVHGDLWEYVRNNDLNANYFFNTTGCPAACKAKPIPSYHQNLFGFTAGGPVVIPHVIEGKNRLFWFADYQGGRYVLPEPDGNLTVPSKGMVSSAFTNLQDNITYNTSNTCSATVTTGCHTDALGRTFSNGTIMDPASTRQLSSTGVDAVTGLTGTPNAYVRDPFYNCTAAGGCTSFTGLTTTDFTQDSGGVLLSSLNVIPTSRQDPNAVKLLGLYPAATASGLANDFTGYVPPEDKNTNTYDIRIDYNISPKNILFGVYDRSYLTADVPSYFPGVGAGQSGGRVDQLPAWAWAVGYTRILTPTLTNDMHVGMVHSDKLQVSVWGDDFGSGACSGTVNPGPGTCNIPLEYGIQGVPQVAGNGGLPIINIGGLRGIGVGNYSPTLQYVWSLEGVDAVTKVWRNHAFKTGIQVDDLEANISQPPQGRGDMSFNGQYTDISNKSSGLNGISDMLLTPINYEYGVGTGVNLVGGQNGFSASNIPVTDDHRWYIGAYFQDDWKVNPKLTLNLGVRWDLFTPYDETRGYQSNFLPAGGNGPTANFYIPNQGCQTPRATIFNTVAALSNINIVCSGNAALGNAQKTNFAPRVGFAYRLRPTLVVRGGFGTAYGALGNLGYGGTLGLNYPFGYTQTIPSPDSNHPTPAGSGVATLENTFNNFNFTNPTVLQSPTPYTGTTVCSTSTLPLNSCVGGQYIGSDYLGATLNGRQFNFQTPLVQTQNFTVEDQFTTHDALQVGYVGTEGRHLDILGTSNQDSLILPPGTNTQLYVPYPYMARGGTYETTNANTSYNSMQITYQHQMSFGLLVLANYTYSRCTGDQHAPQNSEFNAGYRAQWLAGFGIKGDYGLCDADATDLWHGAATYDLPVGRGRQFGTAMPKAADLLVGGWELGGFYTFQSGQPLTVTCPVATSADFGCSANVVAGQNLYAGPHNFTQWLNPSAFAPPPPATQVGQGDYSPLGTSGIQQVRGPHYSNLDSAIFKNFNFTESRYLQFRADAFNLTNTPPFVQPQQLNFQAGSFSNIGATKNSNGNNGARTLQLALKMYF
ncbi:MAG: TonB-dependent receptor domain-containing protein [Terracidiphilus sp.]